MLAPPYLLTLYPLLCCVVQIYGPESSGKTMLSLSAIAEVQKQGGKCAFIDAENSFNPEFAKVGCLALRGSQSSMAAYWC